MTSTVEHPSVLGAFAALERRGFEVTYIPVDRDGVLDLEPWTDFMRSPDEAFKAQVWDEHFTREELRDLLEGAYRKFYWRPKFVLRNITQIRNPTDFKRKATAGLRLLTG